MATPATCETGTSRGRGAATAVAASIAIFLSLAGGAGNALARPDSLPTCPASTSYGGNPHPNCLIRQFAVSGAAPVTGTVALSGLKKREKGWWIELTVKATYTDGFKTVCPPGAVPYASIPCHNDALGVTLIGLSVPGQKTLSPAPITDVDTTGCSGTGPCVRHLQVPAYVTSGHLVLVFQVIQGSVTTNPGNDLGAAGFETAVPVTIPKYVGAPPKCLAAGTC